jgi:hypothetical protein
MANKRVSELAPITAPELDFADLLLLSDITAHESKKLQLSDLSNFLLLDGQLTGSLLGTASYAFWAGTASFALNSSVPSNVLTASYLWYTPGSNTGTSSYALAALSASYALSSSYAITASYALTSSVELVYSSAFADYARTASYLLFTPGSTNGTASYALTASYLVGGIYQVSASYASTSSWAWDAIFASASLVSSQSFSSSYSNTASFMQFNGVPNGTASYALVAGNVINNRVDYGIFTAISTSVSSSQLDVVAVTPTFGGLKNLTVQAVGTYKAPYTTSVDGTIQLWAVNRAYGISQSLDSTPITFQAGGVNQISGTIRSTFVLNGQAKVYGLYEVFVTASNGVFISSKRATQYDIVSDSDQLAVYHAEPLQFITSPSTAILLYSSSLYPGVAYQGSASQVTFSGSYDVNQLLVPPGSVGQMQYTWTLTGCQTIVADGNAGLTSIGGLPTNCISFSAANCSLVELPPLDSGSLSYLNVPNNTIVTTLNPPSSMSYINVANNFYVTLPLTLPPGLSAIIADGLGLTYVPYGVPDTLLTMSFANCGNLASYLAPALPASLGWWDSHNSPLTNLPTSIPTNTLYMNVSNNLLQSVTIGGIAAGLVANGKSNGYFSFLNNPGSASAFNIFPNITTLRSRGWSIIS